MIDITEEDEQSRTSPNLTQPPTQPNKPLSKTLLGMLPLVKTSDVNITNKLTKDLFPDEDSLSQEQKDTIISAEHIITNNPQKNEVNANFNCTSSTNQR